MAYWAAKFRSYEDVENYYLRSRGTEISDDTIRKATNYIGSIVHDEDMRIADEAYEQLEKAELNFRHDRNNTLYLLNDGATINTTKKDADGSSWRENKLGLAFSDDHIYFRKQGKDGERQHEILKKEYISLIGSVKQFKKLFFALVLRNGYGAYKNTVLISDGATWIRNMKEELFPDAQQILNLFHLKENVNEYILR